MHIHTYNLFEEVCVCVRIGMHLEGESPQSCCCCCCCYCCCCCCCYYYNGFRPQSGAIFIFHIKACVYAITSTCAYHARAYTHLFEVCVRARALRTFVNITCAYMIHLFEEVCANGRGDDVG